MSLLVVGSIGFDTVETPFGRAEDVLGGSATYFSLSASYFTDVSLIAVVGEDFPESHIKLLKSRRIDVRGLVKARGKTFRWKGRYSYELNEAHTIETQLNVFEDFNPKIPDDYRDSEVVFLANIDPELQIDVLHQMKGPKLIACDTMNYWIEGKYDALKKTLKEVDILLINDGEAREMAREPNLVKAAQRITSFGPKTLIIKRGEYGALMFNGGSIFSAPAYPLETVYDPTGAGDSFAGGFLGYLANTNNFSEGSMRQAIIFGSVMASYNVEDFSINRIKSLDYKEIEERFREFKRLTFFEDLK